MAEPIRYISVNSNHTFDFNYQKASLLELLDALKRNDATSAKLKKMLIDKARETLGLNRLPDSDRVTPFFHCQEGEFHVTFLYDSVAATSTPWEIIIANNFGELIPLFLEIYELLKRPIFNSSSATIGNYSVFHHQNAIGYHTNTNTSPHRYLEYNNAKDTDTNEDMSVNEMNEEHRLVENQNQNRRGVGRRAAAINNKLVSIKKSTSTRKGKKNSMVTESIQMSSSMPSLGNSSMFSHRYETRHQRKNNSILAVN